MNILSVTESMIQMLRLEIVTGQLTPGSKLNEIDLSDRYGVSRPPLREAFRRLENEKLVVTIPRKGTYVTKLSIEDCMHVYFVRHTLECAAIDVIVEKKDVDLTVLRKAINQEKSIPVPQADDVDGQMNYYLDIAKFHWLLSELSGNVWLMHCYQSLGSTLMRYQIIYYAIPGTREPAIQDHTELLSLIASGEAQKAKKLLVSHILEGRDKLIAKMRANNMVENLNGHADLPPRNRTRRTFE